MISLDLSRPPSTSLDCPRAVKAATEEVYQLHASVHHGAFASPQVQRELEEQAEAAAARKDLHPSAQKVVTKE